MEKTPSMLHCEERIEQLTKLLVAAPYRQKPWFWRQRLWWRDMLEALTNKN